MKSLIIFFFFISISCFAQFAPPAGLLGSTAIYKDSSVFEAWATECKVIRGLQDISDYTLGYASTGDSTKAIGRADNLVVSLGDGGSAILSFANPITNGIGWDFAVFENSFNDLFLELAYVEVSSDGINFFRFPATSNTQENSQIASFGTIDATQINNLAGKYRVYYGTPFDLQELPYNINLDINRITQVKIIDVVGSIQDEYAHYDLNFHKINDPYPTPFSSGGFDLDAVGVIHQINSGVQNYSSQINDLNIFPNPINNHTQIQYYLNKPSQIKIYITDLFGREIKNIIDVEQQKGFQSIKLNRINLPKGIYFINLRSFYGSESKKIIIDNE